MYANQQSLQFTRQSEGINPFSRMASKISSVLVLHRPAEETVLLSVRPSVHLWWGSLGHQRPDR